VRALQAWHAAYEAAGIPGFDWRIEQVGDALCSVSSSEPSILLNRVLELGSTAPPGESQLRDIRDLYEESGVSRFFLHIHPGRKDDDTDRHLEAAGYRKYRGWMKFVRGQGAVRKTRSDLDVRPVGIERGAQFAAIAAPAFDMLERTQPVVALLPGVPGQQAFMSFDGDVAAGTGAVYLDEGIAMLDWGATHPDLRRRGGQTAVLCERIRFALDLGCNCICTMTGEAVRGDPQHSYSNILKNGFEEAYLRENWVP
jgi:hypothetical protein